MHWSFCKSWHKNWKFLFLQYVIILWLKNVYKLNALCSVYSIRKNLQTNIIRPTPTWGLGCLLHPGAGCSTQQDGSWTDTLCPCVVPDGAWTCHNNARTSWNLWCCKTSSYWCLAPDWPWCARFDCPVGVAPFWLYSYKYELL